MPDEIKMSQAEWAAIEERLRVLTSTNAAWRRVLDLIESLDSSSGLAALAENLVRLVATHSQAINVTLYCRIGATLQCTDAHGRNEVLATVDDPMVQAAFTRQEFIEQERTGPAPATATSSTAPLSDWAIPLVIGEGVVAVIKLDVTSASAATLRDELRIFFAHAARALKAATEIAIMKRAEDSLSRQTRLTDALFNQAISCFVIFDTNWRFLRVNDAYVRHYNKRAEEVIGRLYSEVFPSDDIEKGEIWRRQLIETKEPLMINEGLYIFADQPERGNTYWDIVLQPLLDKHGNVEFIFFSSIDVTERHRAQEALQRLNEELEVRVKERTADLQAAGDELSRNQHTLVQLVNDLNEKTHSLEATNRRLEAVNKELQSFSYSVSHDLRAPLRGIDGFSRALFEDYADKLDEGGRDLLVSIRASARRMGQLIDDLLTLSQVTRNPIHLEHVDLSQLVHDITAELARREPLRQVELTIAPSVTVKGDARLLRVALENLLGNAWKFTSRRTDACIEFGVTRQKEECECFIRDNGAGFDMSRVRRLFGPFQRLHAVEEFPGNGIGLATVRRVINRHGGRTWAESQVDAGATFFFTIPEPPVRMTPSQPRGRGRLRAGRSESR